MDNKELRLQISPSSIVDGVFNFRQFYYYIANEYFKTGRNISDFTYLCNERSVVFLDFKPNQQLIVTFTCFGDNTTDLVNLFAYHSDTGTFSRQHLVYNPMAINGGDGDSASINYSHEKVAKQSLSRFKKVLSNLNFNLRERINFNHQLFIDDTAFWNTANAKLCELVNSYPEIEIINVDEMLSFVKTDELRLATDIYNYRYQPLILLKDNGLRVEPPTEFYPTGYYEKELGILLNFAHFNSTIFSGVSDKFEDYIRQSTYSKADDPEINANSVNLAVSFLKPNHLNIEKEDNFAFLDLKGMLIQLENYSYTKYPKLKQTNCRISDKNVFTSYKDVVEFCQKTNQQLMNNVLQKQALLKKARADLVKQMEEQRSEIINKLSELYDLEIQKVKNINIELDLSPIDECCVVGLENEITVI
jgi:hypothetical protein